MLNDSDAVNRSTANGSTTVFPYTFKVYDKTEMEVLSNATVLTVDVDYTVDGVGADGGGNVTITSPPSNGVIVTRLRKQPTTQGSNYQSEAFPPERIEKDFDKMAMRLQQIKEQLRRCWSFVKSSSTVDQTVDTPTVGLFARAKVGGGIDWATPAAVNASLPLAVTDGGTGATTAAGARANLLISPMAISEGGTGATTAGGARANLLNYAENTLIDAKGDLLSGSAADTLVKTAVSTVTGEVLVNNPSAPGGISWAPRSQPNPIINGNMDIWQEGASFVSAGNGTYSAEMWKWMQIGTGVVTLNRSTNVPTVAQAGVLFNYSLEVDVTNADVTIGASDLYAVATSIEGYNWRPYAQRPLCVSLWVMAPEAGYYSVALRNSGQNRTYPGVFQVTTPNTWEFKTVVFSASPSAGTWDYTSGIGVDLIVVLAAGSNYIHTAAEWNTANTPANSLQTTNAMSSTANFFRLTGVKMEWGSIATPTQFVPFEEELARCERYFQKSFQYATAPAQNVGTGTGESHWIAGKAGAVSNWGTYIPFRSRMRGMSPVVTLYNPSAANAQIRDVIAAADFTNSVANYVTDRGFVPNGTGNASTAVGNDLAVHWTANVRF